uniref:DNA-directed RNA polymerase III subunit RPC9 n=1 Tax=Trichuris muris TaxID=70415 RepID=A0A5S6Q4Q9_TRIMR
MPIFKLPADHVGTMCNLEVSRFVKEELEVAKWKGIGSSRSFCDLLHELVKYFELIQTTKQTEQGLSTVIEESAKLLLSKMEVLQIVNTKPRSQLDVQLIVEDCANRLTEEQVEKLLVLCEDNL